MTQLKALIFDVDGTLADTERDGHRVAFNLAFAEASLDWHWSEELYGELLSVTGGKERIRKYLDEYRPDFTAPVDLDEYIAQLHAAKTYHYTQLMESPGIPLRPGVERLLREARDRNMRLAIATTTTPENVGALLKNSLAEDAEDWFEIIAAGDIVPAKKPAPDIYIWAMQQMGLEPDQCMAFEDSYNGVRSVLDSGIKSFLVTVNGYTREQDFTTAPLVLTDLGEPDQPFELLQGEDPGQQYIDLDLLMRLHGKSHTSK